MKKLPACCEEVTSVWNKFTNYKTKGWGYLGKVGPVICHDFGHLEDIYLQNSRVTWKFISVWESYQQIGEVTSKLWRSYLRMEQCHKP